MAGKQKILLSGVKPTGRPHIGNYFGAMRQFVDLQDEYKALIFVADYHALTTLHDAEVLRENVRGVVLDYLAIGLDPQKTTLFRQSDVPEHTELAWVFNSITTMPFLMRAHAFKDAEARNKEISVGTFDYPLLMAADILLYDTNVVPVGQDQKQHVEITRDTAEKFNRTFGEMFTLPEPLILEETAIVPGIDGQKMSKSYNNTIPLFADNDEIEKAIMGIVTDSKGVNDPKEKGDTIMTLSALVMEEGPFQAFQESYVQGGIGYGDAKKKLAEEYKQFVAPLREKRESFAKNKDLVEQVLEEGKLVARERAAAKMETVRRAIGIR